MQTRPAAKAIAIETVEAIKPVTAAAGASRLSGRADTRAFYLSVALAVTVVYLSLAVGRAVTDSPGCDEGWFASPAHNLVTKGHMGTTVIEESNLSMTTRIHQFTYWVMPLNILAQASLYKIFGFGLFVMRGISVIFGLIALAAWFFIIKSLTNDRKVALLTLALIALDFAFIRSASTGRMDMMCAALNFAAFASYLRLRGRNFAAAVFISNALVALSGLTHPNGVLGFIGIAFLTLYYDRRSINWRHALTAAAPYVVGGAGYLLYVIHDPNLFLTQLSGNGGGRLWGLAAPLGALKYEITERYLGLSAGGAANYLKVALVAAYALGVAGAICTRELRSSKGYRALLIISALFFAHQTFLEGTKLYLYLVHITPIYAALLAAWVHSCWVNRRLPRWIVAPAFCGLVLLHLAGSAYVMARDSYHKSYLPAVAFLNQNSSEQSLIMGTAELSFGLKAYDSLLDDKYLGYNSGRAPDFIVVDARYEQEHEAVREKWPEVHEHIDRLLAEDYRRVFDHPSYRVYARR
jgi:4-amino-4-deoxy-L-arabinose transferase-like glycosyltransferase